MTPIMPQVIIKGDTPDRIMARSGDVVGWSGDRIIWRFGFLRDSDMYIHFKICIDNFIWIIANKKGKILDRFEGYAIELPKKFIDILKEE